MTDQQCGLCLSCGAPFLPEIDQVDFFNRQANLSVLFLNTEFQENRDIRRMYDIPKLCSKRQASHMIHESYHETALDYMCNRHDNDNDVGPPAGAAGPLPANMRIPRVNNAPFLYYHTASDKKGAQAATWIRPPRNERIPMSTLITHLRNASHSANARDVPQNLKQTYDMCHACNALMTQKSHWRFLLGVRGAGRKNQRGRVIRTADVITQYKVTPGNRPIERGYGYWRIHRNPQPTQSPGLVKSDSDAPCIAYYLHMCLPYRDAAGDGFHGFNPPMLRTARALFLQLCWLVMEIACLATLLNEGTVTKRGGKRSHGMHQHKGVLDVYVSYFFWRLVQFEYGANVHRYGMDFIQWHQKYFTDARNCPALAIDQLTTIGRQMSGNTDRPARVLVITICQRLVRFYENELMPLVLHVTGHDDAHGVPREIGSYFLGLPVMAALQDRSREVRELLYFALYTLNPTRLQAVKNDFQSAVGKFGINALLFRLIDLCQGYPPEFYNQLLSFRSSWQWREIERVRLANKGLEAKEAYRLYFLCTLLFPPTQDLPKELEEELLFQNREYCSPWTSVIPLENVGAFRYQAIDV
jgi:hypothetical protein